MVVIGHRGEICVITDHDNVYYALTMEYLEENDDWSTQLRVGCFCELGRHRSVAFVEELSRRKWPSEWRVEICHRDVDQSRSKNKSQHHKQSRRDNQKFIGSQFEQ